MIRLRNICVILILVISTDLVDGLTCVCNTERGPTACVDGECRVNLEDYYKQDEDLMDVDSNGVSPVCGVIRHSIFGDFYSCTFAAITDNERKCTVEFIRDENATVEKCWCASDFCNEHLLMKKENHSEIINQRNTTIPDLLKTDNAGPTESKTSLTVPPDQLDSNRPNQDQWSSQMTTAPSTERSKVTERPLMNPSTFLPTTPRLGLILHHPLDTGHSKHHSDETTSIPSAIKADTNGVMPIFKIQTVLGSVLMWCTFWLMLTFCTF